MIATDAGLDRRAILAASLIGGWLAASPSLAGAADLLSMQAVDRLRSAVGGSHISGMAAVATMGGKTLDMCLSGEASRAFAVPVSDRTLFNIGSIGKHVTAVALLRLAEQGKLDLDAPIARYVSGPSPAWGRATIYQLMTHISGLARDFTNQEDDRPFGREHAIACSFALPPVADPGQAWCYSNIGYTLLGYVIENVAGEEYGRHVTERLFRAHGLSDSRTDDGEAVIPRRAEPVIWRNDRFRRAFQMSSTVSAVAAGGLLMSARDVPAWERALSGRALLTQRSKDIMFTSARLNTGREVGYGTGWRVEGRGSRHPFFMHTGSVQGFRAFHFRAPHRDVALMVLAVGEARMVSLGLEATEKLWPTVTPLTRPAIPDADPELTRIIRHLVVDRGRIDPAWLAPELARMAPNAVEEQIFRLAPAEAAGVQAVTLIEDTASAFGRERRYIIDLGGERMLLLACYSPDKLICRVFA